MFVVTEHIHTDNTDKHSIIGTYNTCRDAWDAMFAEYVSELDYAEKNGEVDDYTHDERAMVCGYDDGDEFCTYWFIYDADNPETFEV